MTPDQPPVAAAIVSLDVQRAGYAIADVESLDDFVATCASLGKVLSLQDVALIPRSARHVNNPAAVPLHCDGPEADVVAWYCVRQDEHDGASILLDTRPILRSLSPALRQQLSSIGLPYFNGSVRAGRKATCRCCSATTNERGVSTTRPGCYRSLSRASNEMRSPRSGRRWPPLRRSVTRLHAGQCLFVDNWRVLHDGIH